MEKWKHNEKVRQKRYGYRFSSVWEYERHARVNLKLTKFLYHGTQEKRLTSILKDKTLKPNCETKEVNYTCSHTKSVYFTTDKEQAENWAKWSIGEIFSIDKYVTRTKEKAFVIAIPKKLLAHRLKLDDNLVIGGQSFRVEGPIRLTPECIIEEVKEV